VADRFVGRNGLDPVRQAWTGTFAPEGTAFEIVPSGHFVPEENPQATLAALERFLQA
jgi:haloacetate dehalogenase